jgi:hypothetical protein
MSKKEGPGLVSRSSQKGGEPRYEHLCHMHVGSEEIDQQKFENAEGTEGIERLVGVGVEEKREGWKVYREWEMNE